jgi:hypothetical protein
VPGAHSRRALTNRVYILGSSEVTPESGEDAGSRGQVEILARARDVHVPFTLHRTGEPTRLTRRSFMMNISS